MHTASLDRWKHDHDFCGEFAAAEKKTRRVLMLTAAMMVVEIFGGLKLHSMALFADGWHMATHVAAFVITVGAYALARKHATDSAFSFGTGKISVLGAYTSAIVLGAIAMFMAGESVLRFFHPLPIHFNEAITVACVGLGVNVLSALLLKDHGHHHHHHHGGHSHGHEHHHHEHSGHEHQHHEHHRGHRHGDSHDHDLNLKSAYIHVIADAFTSLLAITALVGGKFMGWVWLDPVMGIVGAAVITQWAYSLVRDTNVILLDRCPESSDLAVEIRKAIEADGDTVITDLHIWQVAVNKFAAIISLVAHDPKSPEAYKELLKEHEELVHVTVEVHRCEDQLEPSRRNEPTAHPTF